LRVEVFLGSSLVTQTPSRKPRAACLSVTLVEPRHRQWNVARDLIDYGSASCAVNDLGTVRFDDIDLEGVPTRRRDCL
jgi:hypothetical protein